MCNCKSNKIRCTLITSCAPSNGNVSTIMPFEMLKGFNGYVFFAVGTISYSKLFSHKTPLYIVSIGIVYIFLYKILKLVLIILELTVLQFIIIWLLSLYIIHIVLKYCIYYHIINTLTYYLHHYSTHENFMFLQISISFPT